MCSGLPAHTTIASIGRRTQKTKDCTARRKTFSVFVRRSDVPHLPPLINKRGVLNVHHSPPFFQSSLISFSLEGERGKDGKGNKERFWDNTNNCSYFKYIREIILWIFGLKISWSKKENSGDPPPPLINKRGVLNVPHHHSSWQITELSDEKRFPTCTLWSIQAGI